MKEASIEIKRIARKSTEQPLIKLSVYTSKIQALKKAYSYPKSWPTPPREYNRRGPLLIVPAPQSNRNPGFWNPQCSKTLGGFTWDNSTL
jgi:hypothetical protein